MTPYWYTLILKEEAHRLDISVKTDAIEHALSYISSIEEVAAKLKKQLQSGETK